MHGQYAAFLGGTETFGKFVEEPFPALVEAQIGLPCINLGWPNAGLDVMVQDSAIMGAAAGAAVTVLQVPGAQSLSNRFYSVHPRRNDRFVEASPFLRAIYPDVDFTDFHFVRHLLCHLYDLSPDRFALVREELQAAWVVRMMQLLRRIDGPVLLLWMSPQAIPASSDDPRNVSTPALVTRAMLDAVTGSAVRLVDATLSSGALSAGRAGMIYSEFEAHIAAEVPGPAAHDEVALRLAPLMVRFA